MHTETQFGILPTLEFDGKRLSGNGPIARYLAEKYGENVSSILPCMMHQQYNCCAMIRLSVQWNFFVWEYFFRAITHPFSSNKFTQQKYTLIPPCFVVSQARPFPFLSTDRFQYTYYML